MDFDGDFTHVGYVDKQTLREEDMEDMDSWLSVEVGEMDEIFGSSRNQTMDSSAGKRHLEPLKIPQGDGAGDKRGRRFVYDESPKKPETLAQTAINTVSPVSALMTDASPAAPDASEEEELKISFMNFNVGSIALFVPVDAQKKVWMAFHSGRPNRFLAESSIAALSGTTAQGRAIQKTRILARITRIEQYTYTSSPSAIMGATASSAASVRAARTPTSAAPALTAATAAPATAPKAASIPAGGAAVKGTTGQTGTIRSSTNPYGLAEGEVYYVCYAEPVTIVKHG